MPSVPSVLDRDLVLSDLVSDGITLVETHISWVLLGSAEVWKLKKPVQLGFLDFGTVERRKAACEAELALNRRLAPGVYLGLVPVTREASGRLALGGQGEPVDWAVHMRRLPDRDRADVRLAEGRLDRDHVERIAARLADFHAQARCDQTTAAFGRPEAIAVNVRENFDQTRDDIARFVTAAQAEEIERTQLAFLDAHADRLQARVAAGRVRDGHGDLRLEHVYLHDDGEVTIIDCIEFNDRFRYADVAADLAFLAMDLSEHQHVELSEHLVACYAQHAGDYDLYAVLDFYESYRAYVRGKIASFVAASPDVDHERRLRAEASARHHFLLALASERRPLLGPAVIAVGGIIASGKSTMAAHLGWEMSAPVVEADRTRKQMLGVKVTRPVHEGSWQGAYDPAFTEEVYAEVFRRARVVVESGRPVLVDASFRGRALRGRARALAQDLGVPFRMIECRVDPELARARLRERATQASVSDGRLEIFDDFVARWEPVQELPPAEHLVVDTSRPIAQSLAEVREVVRTWPPGLS
ncbi:MAG: AAA family ATPase [Myxococcales bacterium]|nr:AAA family ATPase [Myxococcales bacterium]